MSEELAEQQPPDSESEGTPEVKPSGGIRDMAMAAYVDEEQKPKKRKRLKPKPEPEHPKQETGEGEDQGAEGDEAPEEKQTVTQRRRAKMSKNASYKGIPSEKIMEAIELYDVLDLRISRINARGGRSSLGRFQKSPQELNDIDIWLREVAGGGRFHVEPLKHGEPGRADPIPQFEFEIDGPAKAFKGSDIDKQTAPGAASAPYGPPPFGAGGPMMAAAGAAPSVGQQPYVEQKHLPAFVRGLPAHQQVAYAQQFGIPVQNQHPNQAPSNAFASDQIAAKELDNAREELRQERERHQRELREQREREEQLRQRMEKLEQQRLEDSRKAAEERHRVELERLRADQERDREQFKMMLEQHSKKEPTPSLLSSPGALEALGGVVTAYLKSQADTRSALQEQQSRSQETLLKATMASKDNKPMVDALKAALPALVPLLSSIWESKSPKAQQELVATMAENQLTSISMMAELINAFGSSQQEPPFWLPMAQETLRGVVQAAESMANRTRGGQQPQQQPQPQPQPQQQPQQQPGTAIQPADSAVAAMASQLSPQQITQMILQDSRYPEWGRNEEWGQAVLLLHSKSPNAPRYIANLLWKLDDEGRTPPEVEPVWDNASEVLQRIISPLPIWHMDRSYAVQVINETVEILTQEGDDERAAQPQAPQAPQATSAPENAPAPQYVMPQGPAQPPHAPAQQPAPAVASEPPNGAQEVQPQETFIDTLGEAQGQKVG